MFKQIIVADSAVQLKSKILELADMLRGGAVTSRTATQTIEIHKGQLDNIPKEDPAHAIMAQMAPPQKSNPSVDQFLTQVSEISKNLTDEQVLNAMDKFEAPAAPPFYPVPGTNGFSSNPKYAPSGHTAPADDEKSLQPMTGDLDSEGMPFDLRIHANTKTKTAKGVWTKKRRLDEAFLKHVEDENRARVAGQAGPAEAAPSVASLFPSDMSGAMPSQAPNPFGNTAPNPFGMPAAAPLAVVPPIAPIAPPVAPVAPVVQAAPAPTPGPWAPAPHDFLSFKANLVPVFADLQRNGKIDKPYLLKLRNYFGVDELWELDKDEKKCFELFTNFAQAGLILKVG